MEQSIARTALSLPSSAKRRRSAQSDMDKDDDDNRDKQAYLLDLLDERILAAEERELLADYDQRIARAEQRELYASISSSCYKALHDAPLENRRGITTIYPAPTDDATIPTNGTSNQNKQRRPKLLLRTENPTVQGLKYVRVTKLIPISFMARQVGGIFPRIVLEDAILEMFQDDVKERLAHSYHWKGFAIRLQCANPTAWRMVATGYRHVIDLLLASFRQRSETQSFDLAGLEADRNPPLRFVKAEKRMPRSYFAKHYGHVSSRTDLEAAIVQSFRRDFQQQLSERGYWMGFRVKLISCDPTSYRLEATGFEKTVNVLLTSMMQRP